MTTTTVTENQRPWAQATFSLFNLGCSSCLAAIERELKRLAGIRNVTVNHVTGTVLVDNDPRQLATVEIRAFIRKLSYDARVKD
jgi:copper chaperone CopZ